MRASEVVEGVNEGAAVIVEPDTWTLDDHLEEIADLVADFIARHDQ